MSVVGGQGQAGSGPTGHPARVVGGMVHRDSTRGCGPDRPGPPASGPRLVRGSGVSGHHADGGMASVMVQFHSAWQRWQTHRVTGPLDISWMSQDGRGPSPGAQTHDMRHRVTTTNRVPESAGSRPIGQRLTAAVGPRAGDLARFGVPGRSPSDRRSDDATLECGVRQVIGPVSEGDRRARVPDRGRRA